ncbi:MAG: zf-HC2 domain-containing protein, partial [Thermoleophilia bacterium]|nr:zf-HC2 domain-containing protein [Thermoleophilia bacterium]
MANTRPFPTPDAQHVSHLLSSYLDGQVEEGERVLVERHLATCPVCRLELEQLQLIVNAMRATPLAEPTRSFALTPDMVRRRSWLSLWTRYSPAVAAIAGMLLVALLSVDLLLVQGFRGV